MRVNFTKYRDFFKGPTVCYELSKITNYRGTNYRSSTVPKKKEMR